MAQDDLLQIIENAVSEELTELNLSSQKLTMLPPEIGKLTQLEILILGDPDAGHSGKLISLPAEIGQLTNLQILYLNNNSLQELPAEIGQLTNLQQLNLSNNSLQELPAEIGQLANLQLLYLFNNSLQELPAEIGQLTNLQLLNLRYNSLRELPAEIGQLTNLQQLNLSNNSLRELPAEVGQLTNLLKLYLTDNSLRELPAEIGKLTNLPLLYLNNNSLSKIPPEIRQYLTAPDITAQQVLRYYRQILEQSLDYLYEAKLLIVGEGGAGKTTLAKKIEDENYQLDMGESSTEGIEIIQWNFQLGKDRNFRVNIWDFGGQEIYHATHQFFLTKRSLYALVADSRKEDTDFNYWLNIVELLSYNSPLLIVKNEKQDRKREINERQLRWEFTNLKETLPTNLATKRGLPEILAAIRNYISGLPHVGTPLPKTWVQVRQSLEQDDRDHISLNEYLTLCQNHGFTEYEDKLQLSGYLHDLGVCLHFQQDPLLKKTVILRPTWGTDAVYKVLDNPQVVEKLGHFSRQDLVNIWQEAQYASMRDELLQLMKNFKLCYEIPNFPGSYIAPQLLSLERPDYDWDSSHNLIMRFEYEFMPKGILTRFIVEKHDWIHCQTCVWKSGVVLNRDQKSQTKAEVVETYRAHKGNISIRVSGKDKKELLTIIRYELEKIHHSYERLKYSQLIPCNCELCKGSQTPHFYKFETLRKFMGDSQKSIQCQNSYTMISVRSLIDDVMDETAQTSFKHDKKHSSEMDFKKLDTVTQPSTSPRVLISYSHDSKEHSQQVLDLANQLRADGIDCRIDQYISNPSEGWPLWMDKQVEESDFVLIMFTERYTERSQQKRKSGVRFESVLMLQDLYEAGMINDKFIPIVFEQKNSQHIHKWLKPYSYYALDSTAGYESLCRRLLNDPAVEMPVLGAPTKKGPIQP